MEPNHLLDILSINRWLQRSLKTVYNSVFLLLWEYPVYRKTSILIKTPSPKESFGRSPLYLALLCPEIILMRLPCIKSLGL
jgi:hypothetical protein